MLLSLMPGKKQASDKGMAFRFRVLGLRPWGLAFMLQGLWNLGIDIGDPFSWKLQYTLNTQTLSRGVLLVGSVCPRFLHASI